MAERRPAPSRTVPKKQFVHLAQGNHPWCDARGTALTLLDDEADATASQQVCGACKTAKSRFVAPKAAEPVKTFKQRQAEEIQAAAGTRNGRKAPASLSAPSNGRGVPPLPLTTKKPTVAQAKREETRRVRDEVVDVPRTGAKARSGVVTKPARVVETRVTGKRNCTTVAEALIRAGRSNQEVWDVISIEFNLDQSKRGYPAWYRSRLRRRGENV